MEAKKCKYCSSAIPKDKRADSKFCSNSCKANYWEEHKNNKTPAIKPKPEKEIPKPAGKPLDGLRGIIENKPSSDVSDVKQTSVTAKSGQITPIERTETFLYKVAQTKKNKAETEYRKILESLSACDKYLQDWTREQGRLQQAKWEQQFMSTGLDSMALRDACGWEDINDVTDKLQKARERITLLKKSKSELEQWLPVKKKEFDEAADRLKTIPQYEPEKQDTMAPARLTLAKQDDQQPGDAGMEQKEEQATNSVAIQTSDWLISSRELRAMNYKCLNFQGKWKDFFGLPAVIFHLAVHGKPGEGKSTFCIQFADYLAKNFGNVVYISGEEGFSKTLRDKVINNKIDNPNLFFAKISSGEEIPNKIESNKFHFIFMDSLDTLRIDAVRLRELREQYPQSAFITISQSTKDGKMRGSQEIIHDTDIAVKVESGVATTTKNRYQARSTEFAVFTTSPSPSPKPVKKIMDEPKNII